MFKFLINLKNYNFFASKDLSNNMLLLKKQAELPKIMIEIKYFNLMILKKNCLKNFKKFMRKTEFGMGINYFWKRKFKMKLMKMT